VLTMKQLDDIIRKFGKELPRDMRSIFEDVNPLFSRPFGGKDIFVEKQVPKLALSPQCAELVGPEFAGQVNAWLLARFGYREPIAQTPLMFGNKVIMNNRDYNHFLKMTVT